MLNTDNPDLEWRRISPLSVVFFLFSFLRQVITQGLPALAVTFAGITQSERFGWGSVILLTLLILVLVVAGAVLSWLRFRYRLSGQRVLVRKGVIKREELDIEFDRIQNINIREPFYMRPFGLAVLGIDTAGSSGKEVQLVGVERVIAQELRTTILKEVRDSSDSPETNTEPAAPGSTLLELGRRDVLIYGLTANFMLWVAIALGALFSVGGDSFDAVFGWLNRTLELDQMLELVRRWGGTLAVALAFLVAALVVLILLPIISMIGALFRYDGYRLSVEDETYRKSSGLLTRYDESVKQHKIQAVVWKQNLMATLFGRVNLQLRQASAGEGIENGELPTGARSQFLVPSLRPEQASELSLEFLPGAYLNRARFSNINRRSFIGLHMRIWLIPLTIQALILAFIFTGWWLLMVPVFAGAQFLVLQRRWSRWGYSVDGETAYVRSGFIGQVITLFPLFKVQRVDVSQTPLQKRKGLAHVTVHLASHSLEIPYVDEQQAFNLRNYALFLAESSLKPWY